MNTLLVGYDLNKSGQNYDALIDVLKAEANWWHHLDSTWVIKTNKTAVQLRDDLWRVMDDNDELLVINVTGDAAAWKGFTDRGSKWLKDNL